MPQTLSVVVSIFGLIGIGYLAAWTRLLPKTTGEGLTGFVFMIAIPVLLFETIATADFQGVSPWRVWLAFFAPFAIVWVLGDFVVRRLFGRDRRAGIVAGGAAAYSNAVLIGVPLMQAAFGDGGIVFLVVIVSIHLPIMMILSVFLHELAADAGEDGDGDPGDRRARLLRLARSLALHPILIAIVLGALWRATGFALPTPVAAIVEPLARSAGPLALVASGMALVDFGTARQIGPAVTLAVLKLVVMPAMVFVAASAVGLSPLGIAAVTLTAACPTGVNAFLIASRLRTGEALASNTLLVSTVASLLTVTLWLTFLRETLG